MINLMLPVGLVGSRLNVYCWRLSTYCRRTSRNPKTSFAPERRDTCCFAVSYSNSPAVLVSPGLRFHFLSFFFSAFTLLNNIWQFMHKSRSTVAPRMPVLVDRLPTQVGLKVEKRTCACGAHFPMTSRMFWFGCGRKMIGLIN